MIGTNLAHFRITAKLGEGGMGEVYKAEDTKLGREVAIKVLPEEVAGDAERLARFDREARAVAALSHPNILAIYDFGSENGVTYAVMELLEGQTLRETLEEGALPTRKALEYSRQVADGLAAAHEKGVAHRDLKPENLIITRKGRVKILDFGLAKWSPLDGGSEDSTLAASLAAETGPGVVMGTVGYMSPEQVRGLTSDHRSDIFSLGAILYEMLAGQRAFKSDSAVETMSAILKHHPPELAKVVEDLPPSVDRIVQHCLEKDPEQRFQSAQDLAFQLEALQQTSISSVTSAHDLLPAVRKKTSSSWLLFAAVAGLIGGALGMFLVTRPEPPDALNFQRLSFRRGLVWSARFAPDGQGIIYGAAWGGQPVELFTTSPDSPESRPLQLGSADLLSISPSGEMAISVNRHYVVGWESEGTLARLPADGSAPRELLENVQDADWGPDGESLAVVREVEGRVRLEYPIGNVRYVSDGFISLPRVRPQGDRIAFMDHPIRGDNVGRILIIDLEGTITATNPPGVQGMAWTPDGGEVWGNRGNTITAFGLDGSERVVYAGITGVSVKDISADGRVLVTTLNMRREVVGYGPDSGKQQNLSWFDWSQARAMSDDGRYTLFGEGNTGTADGYWLYHRATDGSPAVRIGVGLGMALSPDGRWALSLSRPFTDAIPQLLPTGAGEMRQLELEGLRLQPGAIFLPDGSGFLVAGNLEDKGTQVFQVSLEGGEPRAVTPEGIGFHYRSGGVSPDGDFLATIGPDQRVHLYPLDGGESSSLGSSKAGDIPVQWSDDGRYIFVYTKDSLPGRVDRIDINSGVRELLMELAPKDAAGVFNIDMLHMTRDGRYYVFSFRRLLSDLYIIDGLR
jgi:serine/threonine protein kinase/WD40 repeat protein